MKVCSVIVTYGDRFHLLSQVIDACFTEGVNRVIVIDNASENNSRAKLKKLDTKESRLRIVYLDENTGSAGGYKRGLEEAYKCEECEYIWLLDDDNMPQANSLKVLKDFWNNLKDDKKKEKVSLLSYRKDRVVFKEAIVTNNPNLVLGRKNSFLGFHILDLPKKVIRVLKRKIGLLTFKENSNIKSGKVAVAPYGGMFFHKNIINTIEYPREEFFVYADDHEWSYRITHNGGSIYVVLDSLVDDIDTSWHINSNIPFVNYLFNGTDFRVYYSIRNRTYLELNHLIDNKAVYQVNKLIFINILNILNILNRKNLDRLTIIKKALKDAVNNNLGKRL